MATYAQVLAKIKAALSLRQAGTKVTVAKHEEAEIAILDYIEAAKAAMTGKYNSPYNGTANTVLAEAIKHMAVREVQVSCYFYIGFITAGHFDGTNYNYEILIMQAIDLNDPQTSLEAFSWTAREQNPYTGLVECVLAESDGSGRYGNMVIDWSKLTLGETYTNQSYDEGSLFGYTLISDMGAAGGGGSFLKREGFVATQGQTIFTPSKFSLTADALVILNQAPQDPDNYTIVGNTLTFLAECNADDKVVILN